MASSFNSAAVTRLLLQIRSAVSSSGIIDVVMGHEPKSAPGQRLTAAFWLGTITPVPALSGLNSTTGRVIINCRIYTPFTGQSASSVGDATETALMHAVLEILANYSGEITVGGTVMEIDLLGAHGVPLEAGTVGYIEQDGVHFRVAEITIPVIIDSLWTQVN